MSYVLTGVFAVFIGNYYLYLPEVNKWPMKYVVAGSFLYGALVLACILIGGALLGTFDVVKLKPKHIWMLVFTFLALGLGVSLRAWGHLSKSRRAQEEDESNNSLWK